LQQVDVPGQTCTQVNAAVNRVIAPTILAAVVAGTPWLDTLGTPMPLEHSKPPETLRRELHEVARDARAFMDILTQINALPDEFPKAQLLQISHALADLPDGTAEGCRVPLATARDLLPFIRRQYIISEEDDQSQGSQADDAPPLVVRGATLDQRMRDLIASVTTALDEYRRLSAEETIDENPVQASVSPQKRLVDEATLQSKKLEMSLLDARETVGTTTTADSAAADDLKRQLLDSVGMTRFARAEITLPSVVASWVRNAANSLRRSPALIKQTTRRLRVGVDILEIGLTRWHEFETDLHGFMIDQFRKTFDSLDAIATKLEQHTKPARRSPSPQPPDDFDLREARHLILEGDRLPESWLPFISQLDLSNEDVKGLEALAELPNLQKLDLSDNPIKSVEPLIGAPTLCHLDLSTTRVTDVSEISEINSLQYLDLSNNRIRDVKPINKLKHLLELNLSATRIEDAQLNGLTALRKLDLSLTKVNELEFLRDLKNLQYLNLSGTDVDNLLPISSLTNLVYLDLF
jgi:Leucine-rich repeat (LRR) protein